MCSLCLQSPCDPRCPNAKPPRSYDTCPHCGEGITLGEEYVFVDGAAYHVDCLEDMGVRELISLFGYYTYEVEEEDLE